jgi:uncharacterized membrane protein YjjP (DUF1212 family)
MNATQTTHAALRILLTVLATLLTAAGLVLLLATPWVLELLGAWTGTAIGIVDFLLRGRLAHNDAIMSVLAQGIGVFALCFSYALYAAGRDPVRYLAVVDATIAFAVLTSVVDALSIGSLAGGNPLLAAFAWARVAVRLILAAVLVALRPRQSAS